MKPKVSILVPVYNTEKYIAKTIESILAQTFTDWELIILDDYSQDDTYQICQQYAKADPRIQLYRNEKNLGMMPNWNKGLTYCESEYFGKLDADDLWEPTMIEESVKILDTQKKVGLVCSNYQNMDAYGQLIDDSLFQHPECIQKEGFSILNLVKKGPHHIFEHQILRQGIGLMRKKVFDETGPFTLLDAGDTEMWFRVACHYKIAFIPQVLHYHRVWEQSFTRTQVLKLNKSAKNLYDVKAAIFEYYYKQGRISHQEFIRFSKQNRFEYNKYLAYRFREDKNYKAMMKPIIENFTVSPVRLISFYLSRFTDRFTA